MLSTLFSCKPSPSVSYRYCEVCNRRYLFHDDLVVCIVCDHNICGDCISGKMDNIDETSSSSSSSSSSILRKVCKNCVHQLGESGIIPGLDEITNVNEGEIVAKYAEKGLGELKKQGSAELLRAITADNHWICRSCAIFGTYKSPHDHYCGGAYFGWIIGATPTEGRTCCNCVIRVTNSEAGYFLWSCAQCKVRRAALERGEYSNAGFEVGMSRLPLNTPQGMSWLLSGEGPQSGQEWISRITVLNLQEVNFTSLQSLFIKPLRSFENLKSIDISNNQDIETIPIVELCLMPSLTEFACKNCPKLITPPMEVAIQGGQVVMGFLRELNRDGELNKSMVVFLIGDGECGKTSLLSALKSSDNRASKIDKDTRTVGIDIIKWDLSVTHDVDFVVYDMAGQSIYKDTHTYFVGKRAVYIFVWRFMVSGDSLGRIIENMVESWIDTLQFRIPGASVMVVATHADCATAAEILAQTRQVQEILQNRMNSYDALYRIRLLDNGESTIVNCLNGDGIDICRENIVSFSKSLPWYHEPLPKSWINLIKRLEMLIASSASYFLSWNDYVETSVAAGISKGLFY